MGLIERAAHRHGLQLMRYGSLLLVAEGDVHRIVEICEKERVRIVGIEGFWIREGKVVPDMEAIADFSSAFGASSLDAARSFFESVGSAQRWYDFTLSGEK